MKDLKLTDTQANTFNVGYRQLTVGEIDVYDETHPPPRPYPYDGQINVTVEMRAFQSSCNHIDPGSSTWSSSGCTVSP